MFWKNFKLGQKMFLGFGMVIVLMVSVLGYSYINFQNEAKIVAENLQTYKIIRQTDLLRTSLLNIETGARGYAITGKDQFLEPFNSGKDSYGHYYNEVRFLTSSDQNQQDRLVGLQQSYEKWLDFETTQLIGMRQKVISGQAGMEELIAIVQQGAGKKEMDNMRSILSEISNDEQKILDERALALKAMERQTGLVMTSGGVVGSLIAILIAIWITGVVVNPVRTVTDTFRQISEGDANLDVRLKVSSNDEIGHMSKYFNIFVEKLKTIILDNKNQSWLKTGQAELSELLRGDQNLGELANSIISYTAKYMGAQVAAIYLKTENNSFNLLGTYAYNKRKNLSNEIKLGEGIVGQSALERKSIIMTNIPEDYVRISSGTGEALPRNIVVVPCLHNGEVKCLMELGAFNNFTELQLEFLDLVSESIAMSINSVEVRLKARELLEKTMEQSEEMQAQQEELRQTNEELEEQATALKHSEAQLQAQQEELRQSNEELEEQAKALKESESHLQSQQEELRVINEELEERTKSLELQKNDIITKNMDLESARTEIEDKAKALEVTSKYKSEFLANMSHELRTPLNSILVLSQMLTDKKVNTPITEKQLEYARTINSSGQDLLKLINDILDLTKVEAGKMDINQEPIEIDEFVKYVERSFSPIAQQKGLSFEIEIREDAPKKIITDNLRLQQVVNNMLSNAFKFTERGQVIMSIGRPNNSIEKRLKRADLRNLVCFSVKDTGIGIPEDKQDIVFEAFKQSDGTTSRKYGGTGLGLSISRELAKLLGGSIYLDSEEGKGSTFTLVIPENIDTAALETQAAAVSQVQGTEETGYTVNIAEDIKVNGIEATDDRLKINKNEKVILIIEDDMNFSGILFDLSHEKGYKCIKASNGKQGLESAEKYKPDAILLDIGLPDISGWKVVELLKENKATKNIPVHVISGKEISSTEDMPKNIVGYLKKPITMESMETLFGQLKNLNAGSIKKLLILDESEEQVNIIAKALGSKDIKITTLDKGADALELLRHEAFDCLILDLKLKDMSGLELLSKLRSEFTEDLPVIIHTERKLSREDEAEIQKYAESIVMKGSRSIDRLVAEASLFLHEIDSKLEENKIRVIKSNQEKENSLEGKKILIIDDDMRNVFALSSVLEEKGIKVVVGRNGREGLEKLEQNIDTDLVLTDIMMPEMDGYETMRAIRSMEKHRKLPIIALTAKAMKDDRQKCIDAGANEYLTKPIDIDRLISLLRVWLY